MKRKLSVIDLIVLHCSASDIASHDDIEVVDGWHKDRGFRFTDDDGKRRHVGYHYFIKRNGVIQFGRPLDTVGAHVVGENTNSIGICLHGINEFTTEQFSAAGRLVSGLRTALGDLKILGHCDLDPINKSFCPGFDRDKFIYDYVYA